jgi:hypothetical protein
MLSFFWLLYLNKVLLCFDLPLSIEILLFSGLAAFSLFLSFIWRVNVSTSTCQSSSVSSHTAAYCRPVRAPQNPLRRKSCNIRNWNTAKNSGYLAKCSRNCCRATSNTGVVYVGYKSPLLYFIFFRICYILLMSVIVTYCWQSIRPDRPLCPSSLLYNGYRRSSRVVKWPGRGVEPPTPSSAEVREGVELYVYCPAGLMGWTLPYFTENLPGWRQKGSLTSTFPDV